MDRILFTVSSKVSPFETEEEEAVKLIVSADKRFSASSKEILVLVEFSKKRFTITTSRNEGTFFTGRCNTSLNCSAVCKIREISEDSRSLMPSKCRVDSCIKKRN